MKNLVLILALTLSAAARGAPILNENAATGSFVTIYKDHLDPNLYYFAPHYMGVCLDEKGLPVFSYSTFKESTLSPLKGLVMTTLCLREHKAEMKEAFDSILKTNPVAKFAGVAFTKSELMLNDAVVRSLIEKNSCNHVAGVIGQEQACSFILSSRGKVAFIEKLNKGLAVVLQFQYSVVGVVRTVAGFSDSTLNFGVGAKITKEDFR